MVRCYDPANEGGKKPEDSSAVNPATGLPILLRAPYPGQPFQDNVFVGGQEMPVCTPATGGAGAVVLSTIAVVFVAFSSLFLLLS